MTLSPRFCIKPHHLYASFSPSGSPWKKQNKSKKPCPILYLYLNSWTWPQISSGPQHSWANSSSWLFQTFSPLTHFKAPSQFCTKLLLHHFKEKKKSKLEESLYLCIITVFSACFLHPHSCPGSRPSQLPSESPPKKTSFIPESPVSPFSGLFPSLFYVS